MLDQGRMTLQISWLCLSIRVWQHPLFASRHAACENLSIFFNVSLSLGSRFGWRWVLDNWQCWFWYFLSWLGYTVFCILPVYVSVYRPGHGSADTANFRMRRKSSLGTLRKTIRPITYRGHGSMFTADLRQRQKPIGGTLRKTIRQVTWIRSKTADLRTRRKSHGVL